MIVLYSINRKYEKERRDRLNVSFEELRTVLPPSDSNASLGKVDIINHAIDFIRVLQSDKLKTSHIHSKLINTLHLFFILYNYCCILKKV